MLKELEISFIIPCKNEEDTIETCLNSVIEEGRKIKSFEVILVDNGSTDNTLKKVASYGEQVSLHILKNCSISALRNLGGRQAKFNWLAFIDADVELETCWAEGFASGLQKALKSGVPSERVLIGATYNNPQDPSWVQTAWYLQLESRDRIQTDYINGGNLVVHKELFNSVGGFNISCKTSEDVRFCKDAIVAGGKIIKEKQMRTIHYGYPKNLIGFFKRERWHGSGMEAYFYKPWASKEFLFAIYYMFFSCVFILALFFGKNIFFALILYILFLTLPILPLTIKRSKKKHFFQLLCLFMTYGFARCFSVIDIFFRKTSKLFK